ncbi:VOC family protein [uncultured Caballeronia sp.]|uniref:VOC family protein n=1 Tax=uncultured Caballeronia sp. TaxID=1827198 RepID=UPI001575C653
MTAPPLQLDHLVIAARTLEEGASFVAAKLGVQTSEGGAHPLMRTHNRLLNLWGGAYLEVIAIDPAAANTDSSRPLLRPRLFALDDPAFLKRLETGPQLVHWVARVERPKVLTRWQAQYPERIASVVAMSRGANSWNLTVPHDGSFPAWQGSGDGVLPSLIQWDTTRHPSASLPETGIALKSLTGFHPRAHVLLEQMAWLGASHLMNVEVTEGAPVLVAQFELPDGSIVTMGETSETIEAAAQAARQAELAAAKPARKRAKSRKPEDVTETADIAETAADSSPDEAVQQDDGQQDER